MQQNGSTGFKATPLLKALRAAAVMALPPKAASATGPAAAAAAASSEVDGEGETHDEEEDQAVRLERFEAHRSQFFLSSLPFGSRNNQKGGGGRRGVDSFFDMHLRHLLLCGSRLNACVLREAGGRGRSALLAGMT